MRYFAFVCFILIAMGIRAPRSAVAQSGSEITLGQTDLTRLIYELRLNNQSLVVSRQDARLLGTRSRQVATWPDPKVSLSVMPYPIYTARGKQRAQLRIDQTIPYPGKLGLKGQLADLSSQSAELRTRQTEDLLIFELKHAYFELYRVQREQELIHEFQGRLNMFEQVAAKKYEVGDGTQQAILKAQLERNLWSMKILNLEEARISATEVISRLLNRSVDATEIEEIPPQLIPTLNQPLATLHALALEQRPASRMLEIEVDRVIAEDELAHKQFRPDFGFSLTYFDLAASDIPPNADGQNALAIGFSVSIPIQRDGKHARVEEAQIRREQIDAEVLALEIAIRSDINDKVGRMNENRRQLDLVNDVLLPQAESTLEASLSAYTTGQTDFLNLLDSERTLVELRIQVEEITARYLKIVASLEYALGVDSLEDIK